MLCPRKTIGDIMKKDFSKDSTCCFTGHRDIPRDEYMTTAELLSRCAERLILAGFNRFICGGALGFDTVAAVSVINLREKYPDICLFMALPCPDQDIKWMQKDRIFYRKILERADETVVLSDSYTKGCMMRRNRYMVDNSSVCICYVNKNSGGSFYTMNYAVNSGLRVINIADMTKGGARNA